MRLIDADKLIADILVGQEFLDEETIGVHLNLLDCQPTIEVEPVRHGRWIEVRDKHGRCIGMQCSRCGRRVRNQGENYCPNCGARMDGKVEENE